MATYTHPQEQLVAELLLLDVEEEETRDAFTAEEVFDLIRNLNDPEHPLTLEQLKVATVRLTKDGSVFRFTGMAWSLYHRLDPWTTHHSPLCCHGRTQLENVKVDDERSTVRIWFTPTIPHCR